MLHGPVRSLVSSCPVQTTTRARKEKTSTANIENRTGPKTLAVGFHWCNLHTRSVEFDIRWKIARRVRKMKSWGWLRHIMRSAENNGNAKDTGKNVGTDLSIVFRSVFGHKQLAEACVDSGADSNITDETLSSTIMDPGSDIEDVKLNPPHLFGKAACEADEKIGLVCDSRAWIDTKLYVQHSSAPLLQNLLRLIKKQRVTAPLLWRPIQEPWNWTHVIYLQQKLTDLLEASKLIAC